MHILRPVFQRVLAPALVVIFAAGCSPAAKKSNLLERAERYFKAGEYDKARIEYLNLLRTDPQNATAIQQLGIIWVEEGAPMQALPFLLKERDLVPNNLNARTKLAMAFMSLGEISEARKEAIAILDQAPSDDEAIVLLADTARNEQEIGDFKRRLQKLTEHDRASLHLALANLSLRQGDLASAESAIRRALALDPKLASAHLAMASLLWLRGNLAEAGQEFRTAVELAPVRSAARLKYAEFEVKTGALDEATGFLKEITHQAPDYLPAWIRLAQIAFAANKYDESLALLENVFSRDVANFEARLLQAEVRLAKGEVKNALESSERLDKAYPKAVVAKYQLANAYLRDNNPAQAAAVLLQAVALKPNFAEAILLLGEIKLRAGDAQGVVDSMQDLLKKRPNLTQAQMLLATAYQTLGRPDDATAVFRDQIRICPQSSEPQLLLGLILRQQGKMAEAGQAFERAQELEPQNLAVVEQLVDLDLLNKNFSAASQRIRRQLEKTPDSAAARFLEGRIFAVEGDWDHAEAALLRALELDANLSSAYELLISTYVAANKLTQAVDQLNGLLSKNPDNPGALLRLAMVYEKMNRYPLARDTYEKLLSVSPDFPPALNNLAYLYAERLNQLDRAYEVARKARTLNPDDAATADTLGWVLYKRGDYQQALTLLQESASKLPNSLEILFHLGMANYMMGQTEAARTALCQVADTQADFPRKEDVSRRLTLLGDASGRLTQLSVEELEAILKEEPDDVVARVRLGESCERQGAFVKAEAAYELALKVNPRLFSATMKLAQLNAGPLGNSGKAIELARKARELAPKDPRAAAILGNLAYQTGDFAWAYDLLQESARELTNDAGVLHDLAWAAYSLGRVSEAQQTMQYVLKTASDASKYEDAKSFLAMTAPDQRDLLTAEPQIEKLLQANPAYVPALMARASIQVQRGESKAAIGTYNEVLRRFPDFAPAQKYLASLYAEDPDNSANAYDLAMKARKTLSDDPELAQILGEMSYRRKEFAYAVQLLQDCAKKRPLDAKYLYYLGMSHWQLKEKTQSQDVLQHALAAGLQEPLLTQAKSVLADLQRE